MQEIRPYIVLQYEEPPNIRSFTRKRWVGRLPPGENGRPRAQTNAKIGGALCEKKHTILKMAVGRSVYQQKRTRWTYPNSVRHMGHLGPMCAQV